MPIGTKRQGFDPKDVIHAQGTIEMWEQGTATRRFPFDMRGHRVAVAGENMQTLFARKPFGHGLFDLIFGGEMDIAIGQINRRTKGLAAGLHGRPFGGPEDFVNMHVSQMPVLQHLVNGTLCPCGGRRVTASDQNVCECVG